MVSECANELPYAIVSFCLMWLYDVRLWVCACVHSNERVVIFCHTNIIIRRRRCWYWCRRCHRCVYSRACWIVLILTKLKIIPGPTFLSLWLLSTHSRQLHTASGKAILQKLNKYTVHALISASECVNFFTENFIFQLCRWFWYRFHLCHHNGKNNSDGPFFASQMKDEKSKSVTISWIEQRKIDEQKLFLSTQQFHFHHWLCESMTRCWLKFYESGRERERTIKLFQLDHVRMYVLQI